MVESDTSKDEFLTQHKNFSLRETVSYPNGGFSYFYDDGSDMVIIDEGICNRSDNNTVFSYMLITDKQNSYMHRFNRLFRFLGYKKELVDRYLGAKETVRDYLGNTLFDIQDTIEEAEWYHLGTTTRWGNPRHPLYLKGDSEFQWFPVFDYACECRDGDIW